MFFWHKQLSHKSRWLNIIICCDYNDFYILWLHKKNEFWAWHLVIQFYRGKKKNLLGGGIKTIWTFIILFSLLTCRLVAVTPKSTHSSVFTTSCPASLTTAQRQPPETAVLRWARERLCVTFWLYFQPAHSWLFRDLGRHIADFIVPRLSSPFPCGMNDVPRGGLRYIITKQKLSRLAVAGFMAKFMEIT